MTWQETIINLISKQDYQKVVETCEKAIESQPEQLAPYLYLGLVYLLQGEAEEAQGIWLWAMFECPSELDSDERNSALIEMLQAQAQREEEQGNLHNRQLIYQQLQELIPNDINTLLMLVKTALQTGELTSGALEAWQVAARLQDVSPGTANPELILEIFQLALSFPVVGIEPLIATAFEHLEASSHIQELEKRNLETLMILGVTAYQAQKYQTSVSLLKRVIAINPELPQGYSNLGNALKELGEIETAKQNYETALTLEPNFAEVHHNLGNLYRDLGELETAKASYQRALAINSQLDRTYINLGLIERQQGNREQAIRYYQQLLELYPAHAEGYNNLGLLQVEEGNYEEAEFSLKQSVEIKPTYADAYNNLGLLYKSQGRDEEATHCYQVAINCYQKDKATESDFANANHNLGLLFYDQGELDRAEHCYQKALEVQPDHPQILNNLGLVYQEREQTDQAIEYFYKALEIKPDQVTTYSNLGNIFRQKGDLKKALSYYNDAFEIDPDSAVVNYNFAEIHKYKKEGDQYFQRLLNLQNSKKTIYTDRKYIQFALGKAWRDIGDHEQEFTCLQEGNTIKRSEINYTVEQDLELFQTIKDQFYSHTLSQLKQDFNISSESQQVPIFIIGMPRSGTTLTEQILSSHSQITGLGELNYISRVIKENKNLIYDISNVTQEELVQARKQYLEDVAKHKSDSLYFTDKMPYNFNVVGLIKIIFPEAKVIHCQRHPLDVCIANYQRCFKTGNYHSYTLEELGQYYLGYYQLMEHWYSLISDFIYPLHYEKLVTNQEEESRKLIEFCGLDWEDNVLNFQDNKRSIRTASVVQVRQKLYTSSANKWQRYAKHLEHLKQFFEENGVL